MYWRIFRCWMLKYQQEQHAQRMEAEQAQRAFELEIENRKVAQEESKLKQEKIKARTNEVQKAQQIDIERLKVQQEEERKKVQLEHTKVRMKEIELEALKERNATLLREKATDLEHYKEENKREAMAFELQRARNEQIEMLAGCDLQKLQVIKQILQIQNQPNDESGSIDGSQQAIISQNRQLRALLSY